MPCGNPHILNLSNHMMTRVTMLHSPNWPIRACHVTIFQNETLTLIFSPLPPSPCWQSPPSPATVANSPATTVPSSFTAPALTPKKRNHFSHHHPPCHPLSSQAAKRDLQHHTTMLSLEKKNDCSTPKCSASTQCSTTTSSSHHH